MGSHRGALTEHLQPIGGAASPAGDVPHLTLVLPAVFRSGAAQAQKGSGIGRGVKRDPVPEPRDLGGGRAGRAPLAAQRHQPPRSGPLGAGGVRNDAGGAGSVWGAEGGGGGVTWGAGVRCPAGVIWGRVGVP